MTSSVEEGVRWPQKWFRTDEGEITAPAIDLYEDNDDIVSQGRIAGDEQVHMREQPSPACPTRV